MKKILLMEIAIDESHPVCVFLFTAMIGESEFRIYEAITLFGRHSRKTEGIIYSDVRIG